MSDTLGTPEGAVTKRPLRVPHVITDVAEVHAAVGKLLAGDAFCIDIESRERQKDYPNPRTNEVTWVGLAGHGQIYLIPMGHPKGITLVPEHRAKRTLIELYGLDDPRVMTKGGKISKASKEVTIGAVYATPPKQLWQHEVFDALQPLLFSDRAKVGHNVKFDVQSCAKYFGGKIPPGPYHDTIISTHVLDESLDAYDLKSLTCEWLHIPLYRRAKFYPNMGKSGIDNFGLDEIARYLTKDLHFCWVRHQMMMAKLRRKKLTEVYDFEMDLYPVLIDIEQGGFSVNQDQLGEVRIELEEGLQRIEEEAWVMAGDTFQLSHTDTKRWVMFGEGAKPAFGTVVDKNAANYGQSTRRPLKSQGLRVLARTTETKVPQVTQAVLEAYADRGNRMAELFLDWSMMEKLRGTFVEGLGALLTYHDDDPLPRIHTGYKQHGTVTGRLSSARPNLQQLPRGSKIRDLFVAGPGRVLIVADYDQIELRCTAEQSGDKVMTRVFQQGSDIHAQATAAALRIRVEDVTPELRQVGKTLNFATLYGAAEGKIAMVAGGSINRGREFLDRYYAQFAGLKPWKARTLAAARARGDRADAANPPAVVIPPLGRLRRLPDLFEHEEWKRWRAERQAINAVIQGYASYITKMAMLNLYPILKEYPARMVVQVHDEIVVAVDERWVGELQPLIVSTMGAIRGMDGEPILGSIPLLASAGVGYSWAAAKKG